jgi:hypothetical protein
MSNIKEQHIKLLALYSFLDLFFEDNPDILQKLDNNNNLYIYSERLRLFDTLSMLENKYTQFSILDLKIRLTHYIISQHNMLIDFIDDKEIIITPDFVKASHISKDIIVTLKDMVKDLITSEDIVSFPEYMSDWFAHSQETKWN